MRRTYVIYDCDETIHDDYALLISSMQQRSFYFGLFYTDYIQTTVQVSEARGFTRT